MTRTTVRHSHYADHANDPEQVAAHAVSGVIEDLDGSPDFAFVFASPAIDLDALAASIDEQLGCEWVGCSTANEVCNEGQLAESCVVLGIDSEDITFDTAVVDGIRAQPTEGAAEATAQVGTADAYIPLFAGFTQDHPSIDFPVLKGVLSVAGHDAPVVGAASGDDHQYTRNYQFHNGTVYDDALVLTGLSTDKRFEIGLDHGYEPTEDIFMATVEDGAVTKLNGRPAADVYAELIGVDVADMNGTVETPSGASVPALLAKYAHKHPFGVKVGDQYVLKVPETVQGDSIVFSSHIPESAELVLMHDSKGRLVSSAMDSIRSWMDPDAQVAFALVFECAGRMLALGTRELEEVKALQQNINGPFAGFFSYGEIGGVRRDMCTSNFLTISSLIVYDD